MPENKPTSPDWLYWVCGKFHAFLLLFQRQTLHISLPGADGEYNNLAQSVLSFQNAVVATYTETQSQNLLQTC